MADMNRVPLIYVECDVPEGVTLTEYRRSHGTARRRVRRLARLRALVALRPAVA